MTRKVRKFLSKQGYRYIDLNLSTAGSWSPRDSEWNYSDVSHFEHVHKVFNQEILGLTNELNCSIFLQKILFLTIPTIIFQIHKEADTHEYFASSIGIPISIITYHKIGELGANTITDYRFYYRSWVDYPIAWIARLATQRNYRSVISEDMPMRVQRGLLREMGNINFRQDSKELIGYLSTVDIREKNVSFVKGQHYSNAFTISGDNPVIELEKAYLRFVLQDQELVVLPTICPHEGAALNWCQLSKPIVCPWHGRRISKISTIDLKKACDGEVICLEHLGAKLQINVNVADNFPNAYNVQADIT